MKKKELRKVIKELTEELVEIRNRNVDLEVWYENNKQKVEESESWRARFEQSQLTPEYQLKAEDAYGRGVAQTQENVKNYLRYVVESLFLEPADKPEIKSWIKEEK